MGFVGTKPTISSNVVIADAGTIGSASDEDAISIAADGSVTFTQDIELGHASDTTIARSLGDTSDFSGRIVNKGIRFNKHWGHLDRWTLDNNGDTIHNRETLNTKQNYYHKPQFSLRDFWTVNDKFHVTTNTEQTLIFITVRLGEMLKTALLTYRELRFVQVPPSTPV